MNIAYAWLLAGVLLALAELHFAGIGLFFLGLGAIISGASVHFGWIGAQDYLLQWIILFAATGVLALLLWRPLQHFRRPSPGYHNMIGETAHAGSEGISKQQGEARWSGTLMQARLIPDASVERVESGAPVKIVEIKGATLMVVPK